MQTNEGVFIVIEGTDGSGKSTQFKLLTERLQQGGYDVATFDFPRYSEPSSYFVKQYLNGAYGTADEVGPYTASLFYALDRFEAAEQIRQALKAGKIVLADRFVGSNMAHQGTKFSHADQRRGYFIWLDNLEFEMLRIPRPNLSLVLRVPAETAQAMVDDRQGQTERDIHEADLNHLRRSVEVYDDLCQLFPKDFARIDCVRNEQMLPTDVVNNLIWEKIFPLLPTEPRRKTAEAKVETMTTTTTDSNPYVQKTPAGIQVTAAGREFLDKAVTSSAGSVYTFRDQLQATTIAMAMVRTTERPGDLRTVILEEYAQNGTGVKAPLDNEAVQQLAGLHMAVEDASSLLSLKIAGDRLVTCATQPAVFARYDLKDEHGQYKYYTPDNLQGQIAQDYRERMNKLFEHYATITVGLAHHLRRHNNLPRAERDTVWKQACQIAQAVLPMSSRSSISMSASAETTERLVEDLQHDPLTEARDTAQALLAQVKQVIPTIESAKTINPPPATTVQQLADTYLPDGYAGDMVEPVVLLGVWPRNEFDLVADMLYEQSNLPLRELQDTVDKWPYARKNEVFRAYIEQHARRALEKAHYSWDIVSDSVTFRDFQRYHNVDDPTWQQLTPRYGYEVPAMVEEAGLTDIFEACFDISLELHSLLHATGHPLEAQYATLFGHRMRWKVTHNAREAFRILTRHSDARLSEGGRKLALQMHEKLAEVHPTIAEALTDKTP